MRAIATFLSAISLAVGTLAPTSATACDLQRQNGNPADIPGVELSRLAVRINDTFTAGPASQRFYDHAEPLDGITLGFGHWPQAEVATFFKDMAETGAGRAFSAFAECAANFFGQADSDGAWQAAQRAANVTPGSATQDRVIVVLRQTMLSHRFMDRYKKNCARKCRPGQPNLYREHQAWLVPLLRHALRDREVIIWQVGFWTRTIVGRASAFAEQIGMKNDEAAIVAAAAYRSSAPAWFTPVIRASRSGTLSFQQYSWKWNDPPVGAPRDAEGLKRWRHLILWQHYAARVWPGRKMFRARSQKYYTDYLANYWVLPARHANGAPDWRSVRNLDPQLVSPRL